MSFIEIKDLYKRYKMGETIICANDGITFDVEKNEFALIVGPSGAGKSTLLNILGGLDLADEGQILIDGNNIAACSTSELTEYRRNDIGFVFQFYNLIPNLTALENVEMATQIVPESYDPEEILELVGLKDRLHNFPSQLSGGEQQRVAIARAIAKKPKLLLCDEPTGALDYTTGKQVLKLLHSLCETTDTTVIVITHNQAIGPMADRIVEINDARVRRVKLNDKPISIDKIEW